MAARREPGQFLKRKESVIPVSYFQDSSDTFSALRSILSLAPSQRSQSQLDYLATFSQHLKFFSELSANLSQDAHLQCCQYLTYSFVQAGKFVFHEGEEGTRFYIILSGSCSVLAAAARPSAYKQLAILRQGECFGELALISNKPRAASVLCREDSHFAVLDREDYLRILAKIQDQKLQEKVEILQRHPVFGQWSKNSVLRLSYFFHVKTLKRKQVLFEAGKDVSEVYFVKSGDFQLVKEVLLDFPSSPSAKSTRCSVDVTLVGVGEILCAEELLKSESLAYTCVCHSTLGEVMAISREDFKRVTASEEAVDYLLATNLVKQQYRQTRLRTAMKVEREKRAVQHVPMFAQEKSSGAVKAALMKRKVSELKISIPPHLSSQSFYSSPSHSRSASMIGLSTLTSERLTKDFPSHKKTWSDIFITKYAVKKPSSLASPKSPSTVNLHIQSLKDLNPKLSHIWTMLRGQNQYGVDDKKTE